MLSRDLARAFDPVLLARDCGIEPDAWQAKLLRERPRRGLWLASRQSGKTTTALLTTLWTVLYEAPALCLIVSPSLRQSSEAFRTFTMLYHKLDGAPELKAESLTRAELANGSRVISLPGAERTVRGYAGAKLIVLDEASRIDDALIAALRPMMATVNGSLLMLTTPAGRRGEFFRAWTEGDGWTRVRVPASECPRLSKEFLDEEKRELGPQVYKQEYELEFVADAEAVFPVELIDRAFTDEIRSINIL
jgi:hypothetical protein